MATRRRLKETSEMRKRQLKVQGYSTSNEYRDRLRSPPPASHIVATINLRHRDLSSTTNEVAICSIKPHNRED